MPGMVVGASDRFVGEALIGQGDNIEPAPDTTRILMQPMIPAETRD